VYEVGVWFESRDGLVTVLFEVFLVSLRLCTLMLGQCLEINHSHILLNPFIPIIHDNAPRESTVETALINNQESFSKHGMGKIIFFLRLVQNCYIEINSRACLCWKRCIQMLVC
jgi:hypothetical protein